MKWPPPPPPPPPSFSHPNPTTKADLRRPISIQIQGIPYDDMDTLYILISRCVWNPLVLSGIPTQIASSPELWWCLCCQPGQAFEQTVHMLMWLHPDTNIYTHHSHFIMICLSFITTETACSILQALRDEGNICNAADKHFLVVTSSCSHLFSCTCLAVCTCLIIQLLPAYTPGYTPWGRFRSWVTCKYCMPPWYWCY